MIEDKKQRWTDARENYRLSEGKRCVCSASAPSGLLLLSWPTAEDAVSSEKQGWRRSDACCWMNTFQCCHPPKDRGGKVTIAMRP